MSEQENAYRLNAFSGALQGLVIGIFLVFCALTNLKLGNVHVGFVFLPVAAIFYWPLKASYSLSLVCVFLLGLFHDVASNGPLGVWTLCYIFLFMIMGGGVRTKKNFSKALGGFVLALGFVFLLAFVFGFIALGRWPDLFGLLISVVSSIVVFPLCYWLHSLFSSLQNDAAIGEIS